MQNINVEWDDGTSKATGFTSGPQADRFIKYICQRIAPDKRYDKIILIPPLSISIEAKTEHPPKGKIEGWENSLTKQH